MHASFLRGLLPAARDKIQCPCHNGWFDARTGDCKGRRNARCHSSSWKFAATNIHGAIGARRHTA